MSNPLRAALALFVCLLALPAHAERIIVEESVLRSFYEVEVKDAKDGERFEGTLKVETATMAGPCEGSLRKFHEQFKNPARPNLVTGFNVIIEVECVEAALRLHEFLRKDSRFTIHFPVVKGIMTGSNK
jgi:hypothetical protein